MKKYISLIFIAVICAITSYAQSNTALSGKVISNTTKDPIPFASVAILTEEPKVVNGSIALEDGSFNIQGLPKGKYTISISCLGYHVYQSEILIGELNENYDLGKIELELLQIEIDEVEIVGNRSEISTNLDKKSYNMNNNIAQSGGSVMDAMKAMPGISFDQEGKVVIRGSDKVIVLVDGKQSSLTGYGNQKGLDNIPAANIERIEIINNPSAKYDANGMAGIINIIYKKERQKGLHGSAGLAFGIGAMSKARADLPTDLGSFSPTPKYIPSLDLNLKKKKVGFSLQSQILFQKHLPNNEFTTRFYEDGRIIASQVPENRRQTRYIVKGGIDYQFDEYNLLSFSGVYDWESHVDTAQVPYINMNDNISTRYIAWNEEEITGYMNYNLLYEHKFKQIGHVFSVQAQYVRGWEDETYYINDSSHIRTQGRDVTSVLGVENISALQLDYTKPLRNGRLESGTKMQIRNLPVDYIQQRGENSMLYSGLGNWTNWGETIYAGYLNWVHERPRYNIEGGLRAAYTAVFYDMDASNIYYQQNDAYDYFRLFPNIRLSFKLNDRNRFSLFYNYRIDRPGEPQLRMYSKSDDHELVKVGNPYLRPQFTQSFELGYKTNWGNGSLFIAAYYRMIENPYMRVYTQDVMNTDFDVILKSYANTGKSSNQGIEVIFDQQFKDYWKLSGNINYYQNKILAFEGQLLFPYAHTFTIAQTIENTFDLKLTNTFSFYNDYQIQISTLYFAPKNIPQGRQLARSSIDLGVKKKMCKGKGELSLSASDLLNNYGIQQEIRGDGFTAVYENYYETQAVRLGMSYKF